MLLKPFFHLHLLTCQEKATCFVLGSNESRVLKSAWRRYFHSSEAWGYFAVGQGPVEATVGILTLVEPAILLWKLF